ncbi:peptide deformylase [soil metagenome]
MYEDLDIILWPDPRLRKVSKPLETFDDSLAALTVRMFELMREHKGVGLAAPQVGLNIRLFVANATGEPGDDKVYANPQLTDPDGEDEAEEGCLSLPKINGHILRSKVMHIRAQNLNGEWFEEHSDDFPARIWQHEIDHLNGTLLMDRMSPVEKMAAKKQLKELEELYAESQPTKKKKN